MVRLRRRKDKAEMVITNRKEKRIRKSDQKLSDWKLEWSQVKLAYEKREKVEHSSTTIAVCNSPLIDWHIDLLIYWLIDLSYMTSRNRNPPADAYLTRSSHLRIHYGSRNDRWLRTVRRLELLPSSNQTTALLQLTLFTGIVRIRLPFYAFVRA